MLPDSASETGKVDARAPVDSQPSTSEQPRPASTLLAARRRRVGGILDSAPALQRRDIGRPRFLQALFFAYVVAMLAILTFLVPPFQKADEAVHYQRAAALTNLDFVCSEDETGNFYEMKRRDSDFPDVMHVWDVYIFRDVKFNRDWLNVDFSDPRFDEQGRIYGYCELPFVGYLPAATGLLIGKPFESPMLGFYLARILGAVFFVIVIVIALRLTPQPYRPLLYLYAGLPAVLHQVSAVSYDQVQLVLYPLIFAFIARFAVEERPMRRVELLAFAVALILAANVRLLTYAPLLFLFLAIRPRNIAENASQYLRTAAAFAGVGIAVTGAHALLYLPRVAETSGEDQAKPWDQLDFILANPDDFLAASYETLRNGEWLMKQFLSVFGWLEYGPSYFVFFALVGVAGIVIYRTFERDEARLAWPQIAGVLGGVGLTIASLFVSLYMVWNPVGNDEVEGLQGRYFVGLAPLAVFGLSQVASRLGKLRCLQAGLVLAAVVLIYNVVRTVNERYYG